MMKNTNGMIKFGQIHIQNDWYYSLRRCKDKIWVSCSILDSKTLYGEIWSTFQNGDVEISSSEGFEVHFLTERVLVVKCAEYNITSYFFPTLSAYSNIHDKAVQWLNISPGGGLAVSCADDQGLFIWQTDNGVIRRTLDGHISDVSTCRFFPSGLVVLSGGVDMRLRIWSVEDGSCPVTLVGHTGAITSTEIIDRGRNVVSCSRDGSALLWDCGTAKKICEIRTCAAVINSSCMIDYSSNQTANHVDRSDHEIGTTGKLLGIARDDGYIEAVDIFSRTSIFSLSCESAVNTCCFTDDNTLAAGLQDGRIAFIDIRKPSEPYQVIKHGKSSINCLKEFPGNSILVGKGDGSTTCIRQTYNSDVITMELTGPDNDPIYCVDSTKNIVFTACRDRTIRKYALDLNT